MADKRKDFYKLLNSKEDKEYFETLFSYNIALISARLKPAITLNIVKYGNRAIYDMWRSYGSEYLNKLSLNQINLRESEKFLVVLIYDEELLFKYIYKKENVNFLEYVGYPKAFTISGALEGLKRRYEKYNCPHELGIFLGYPVDDVKDFMECSEKKCLSCGYWKVYNGQEKAEAIFKLFDQVKEEAIDNLIKGYDPCLLSRVIKDKFEKNQNFILS